MIHGARCQYGRGYYFGNNYCCHCPLSYSTGGPVNVQNIPLAYSQWMMAMISENTEWLDVSDHTISQLSDVSDHTISQRLDVSY